MDNCHLIWFSASFSRFFAGESGEIGSFGNNFLNPAPIGYGVGVSKAEFRAVAEEEVPVGMLQHGDLDIALLLRGIRDQAVRITACGKKEHVRMNASDKPLRLASHKRDGACEHFAARAVVVHLHL